ncbi:biotin--[acetyl-CoA-carboxylase] ligase [Martelella endophytica]|uniref:biotin--[biotin carboxyl-carrier protein] ligase n=1 Tax=Martelella endophytica TaxID=1486262 RepID=A0A0D5LQI2_MAREN|nr:biotin--[acetyl-CoA-carboxylase] ligase [Martelella endophytica]AJY46464.1 biotin biosynthesis protein [Martelella endophytica]
MAGQNPAARYRHEALDTVGSTNSEALERARAGDPGRLWLTAERQVGGRGRRGRNWVSERGNLYASLLLVDPAPQVVASSLPLVAAVAVERAISEMLAGHTGEVAIKWPNDVLIDRKKVCGILLEAEHLADGRFAVVIGIGVNVGFRPDDVPYEVARIADYVAGADPSVLFAHLFQTMADEIEIWREGAGLAETMRRWRRAACGLNERIIVNLAREQVSGRFAGIDDAGMLIVETEKGTRTFAAGDVFFDT